MKPFNIKDNWHFHKAQAQAMDRTKRLQGVQSPQIGNYLTSWGDDFSERPVFEVLGMMLRMTVERIALALCLEPNTDITPASLNKVTFEQFYEIKNKIARLNSLMIDNPYCLTQHEFYCLALLKPKIIKNFNENNIIPENIDIKATKEFCSVMIKFKKVDMPEAPAFLIADKLLEIMNYNQLVAFVKNLEEQDYNEDLM